MALRETALDIAAWLRELGLERYAQVFQDSEIEPDILSELTDEDFEELGIPLGPRRKLAKAIAALFAEAGSTYSTCVMPTGYRAVGSTAWARAYAGQATRPQ